MIEFVTIDNIQSFTGNPLAGQYKLRYESIIERQEWDIPTYKGMEFDQFDNCATKYMVYRENGRTLGVSRFYPTNFTYMLEQVFPHLVTDRPLPKSEKVWEGSRFCIDKNQPAEKRKQIMREIVVSYLETGLYYNVESIIGVMFPIYLRNIFVANGWDIEYMCNTTRMEDGHKVRSASLPISEAMLAKVRAKTGIHHQVTEFGETYDAQQYAA